MKKVLIILLCCVSFGHTQTVRYVSALSGSDTDNGTTWALAWLTLGKAVSETQVAGDTVACHSIAGSEFTENLTPSVDGTSSSKIVWIDSVRYEDGINLTQPDTVWTAIVAPGSGDGINLAGDDYHTFIGFHVDGALSDGIEARISSTGILLLQCKVSMSTAAGSSLYLGSSAGVDSVISCLLIGTGDNGIKATGGATHYFVNNTIRGNWTSSFPSLGVHLNSEGYTFRNNIIEETSSTTSYHSIGTTSTVDYIDDFNNNIYFAPNQTNAFLFNGASFDLIATWEDSVNNAAHDPDGASNSLLTDPALQSPTTTCFILDTSAAFEAGTDLGYGTDIGYYQVVSSARRRIPSRVF